MRATLRTAGLRSARPHCTCVVVQNVDYDGAAAKLGCRRSWLTERIKQLPHQKIGEAVAFCDCDLRLIQAMCTAIPEQMLRDLTGPGPEPEQETPPATTGRRSLHDLRPAGARRRPTADTSGP
ncbi:hypothetical protein ACKI16_29840 [Streptomyces scabiei]|uniref:hypothetical protein n=1 Tax=Streptomyces scabiei TaxID=1930 RepID=UPI0038F797DB